jgi:predicted AlkP superfamily phosphohydrolase/phosphomutase
LAIPSVHAAIAGAPRFDIAAMSPRVLVLGIDAGDPLLVERFTADGTMPMLAALMREGLYGRSGGLEGFYVGSTWPSFYTGVSPATHGHHSLVQLRPGTYDYYELAKGALTKRPPFWDHLGACGRRVAILDVPLTHLSPDLNGVQTVEWGSHDALYGFRARPTRFECDIVARFGAHPLGATCDGVRKTTADYRDFASRLVAGTRAKGALTRHVLTMERWDFAMQVFTEAHCAGHQCWHLHDATHPAHEPAIASQVDPMREAYAAIDREIGEIVHGLDRTYVIVLAAHGMAAWFGAQFLLRRILVALGVAVALPAPDARTVDVAEAWIARRLPGRVKNWLRPLRDRLRETIAPEIAPRLDVDAGESLCFPVHNGLAVGGIRLNLAGREPCGKLAPDEADAFCANLAESLLALRDETTGRQLVQSVRRTGELYRGAHLGDLPDVLVEWNDDAPIGSAIVGDGAGATIRAIAPTLGVIEGTNRYGRTGEHRPRGFFVARGPGIVPGRRSREVSLLDFAPTFCAMLGAPLPRTEGVPIAELVEAAKNCAEYAA